MSFKNSFLPHQILWKVLFFIPRSAYLKPTATSPCSLSGPPSKSVCSLDLIVLSTNFPRPFPLFLHHHHCFMCERVGVVYCVVVWCVCMHVCVCVCGCARIFILSNTVDRRALVLTVFFCVCVWDMLAHCNCVMVLNCFVVVSAVFLYRIVCHASLWA